MSVYHHFVSIPTPDGPMPMYVSAPEGRDPRPAVLVIQGMHGMESFEIHVAERFAEKGYLAASPDLFHRGPACFSFDELNTRRRAMRDPQVIGDVNAAIHYLQQQPYVQAGPMGILGFCMGGRVSYLMAASNPVFGVAADFYGGGVHGGEGGASPFELTSNIRCPIIIFDGEEDRHPSPEEVRKTEAELIRHGIVHEVHIFPGVGHAFMSAEGPRRNQQVVDEAWSRLFGWFEKHLPVPVLAEARR
jgi:carboxymethylenebutenolidase